VAQVVGSEFKPQYDKKKKKERKEKKKERERGLRMYLSGRVLG
jgi:polynucleotide 5'-kinase involved in rRNA processing